MNNITPENLITVTQGATPVQIATLILLGVIALGVIIGVTKWIVDLKLGTLPHDINTIRDSLVELDKKLVEIDGKLWSDDDIRREIKSAIADHMEKCPFHKQ